MLRRIKNSENAPLSERDAPIINTGQVIMEFTFCMIVILLMLYGVAKIFIWTGRDVSERRIAHDNVLSTNALPLEQIDPYFFTPAKINAVWEGN